MPENEPPVTVVVPPQEDAMMKKVRVVAFAIEKIGFPLLVCVFLGALVWWQMDKLASKIDRCIRNTRAIMTKLKIPVVVDGDRQNQ